MIKKILKIENVGLYESTPVRTSSNWNGELKKQNIIYGENGAGKTTLSILFRSLRNNNKLLKEKQTISSIGKQKVVVLLDDNSKCNYSEGSWDKHCPEIEVFDAHYVEDNVYIGSSLLNSTRNNLFNIIAGKEGIKLNQKLEELYKHKEDFRKQNKIIKNRIKYEKKELPPDVLKDLIEQKKFFSNEIKYKNNHIRQLNIELGEYSKKIFEDKIDYINKYLRFFTPHIRLKKFSKKSSGPKQLVSYILSVNGEVVGFEGLKGGSKHKIKYSLSDGDKSAFAFSFFLAQLEQLDISEKVIVFDDPISSFDQARKNTTINQLIRISKECGQLIVLTHDIYFAKALYRKCEKATSVNLKISKTSNKSYITFHDIETETLSGVFKDINVLHGYLSHGADTELEKREVIRCIRPILEGIIRIKYFNEIDRNEWLADMLTKIEQSIQSERLYRLKPVVAEIREINDYSKEFHHSDPTSPWGDIINDEELRLFVSRTLFIIDKI